MKKILIITHTILNADTNEVISRFSFPPIAEDENIAYSGLNDYNGNSIGIGEQNLDENKIDFEVEYIGQRNIGNTVILSGDGINDEINIGVANELKRSFLREPGKDYQFGVRSFSTSYDADGNPKVQILEDGVDKTNEWQFVGSLNGQPKDTEYISPVYHAGTKIPKITFRFNNF